MATLTGQTIASTYDGLLKLSDNDGLTASVKNIEDGFGVASPVNISTAVLFIKPTSDTSSTPTSGKEFEVVGNALITGDLQIDNINIDGNTISATSGVVTLSNGTIATTQSQSDNSTKVATTAYVDNQVTIQDLDFSGTSGSGAVDLNSQIFAITGSSNEIVTTASGQGLEIGIVTNPTLSGNVIVTGSLTGTQAIFSSSSTPVIQSSTSSTAENLLLIGTDTSAASAPDLVLYRNAGAPADNDTLGVVEFRGNNSADNGVKSYSGIFSRIIDGSEHKGALTFSVNGTNYTSAMAIHNTGTDEPKVIIGNTNPYAVPTHTLDVDGSLSVSNDAIFGGEIELGEGTAKKIQFIGGQGNWRVNISDSANQFVIHSESLAADYFTVIGGGGIKLNAYGSGNKTGTVAKNLAVDSSGNIIETDGGVVDGSGTANDVAMWSDSNTLTDAPIAISGNDATFAGDITATSKKFISTSSSSGDYVRLYAGSGTAQWDIYGSGENLRLSENSSGGGIFQVDSGATFGGTINDLTLSSGSIATNTSNNFALNTPNSLRINIDSNNSATDQIFAIGHNQTAVDNSNNVLFSLLENGLATFAGDVNISGGNVQIGSGHNTASAGNAVIFASYGSGTNIAGGELQLYGGRSTGSAAGGSIKFYTSPTGSSGSGTNSHIQALSIDSSQNATFAGNVNIGSSLSSEKLEVGGTIRIRVPNTSSASLLLNNTDTQLSIENTGGNMIFTTAGAAEKLRLDSSGNLGLGTDAPRNTTNHTSLTVNGSSVGRLDLATSGTIYASFYAVSSQVGLQTEADIPLIFGTGTSSTTALTLDASQNATFAGNITSTGTSITLDSAGSADYIADRINTSSGATYQYKTNGTLKWYHGLRGLANDDFYLFNNTASTNALIITESGSNASFAGNGTFLSALNVKAADNSDLPYINFSSNDGSYNWGRVGGLLQGDGDGALYFSTKLGSSTAEKMRIDSEGRVILNNSEGIQLSDKTSTLYATDGALSFYGTSNAVYLNGAGPNGWLRLQGAGTENGRNAINIYGSASDKIEFYTAASNAVTINSSQNVGVGETNPLSDLTVRSDSSGGRGGEISIVNYSTVAVGNEAALNFGLETSTYQADLGNAQIKARVNNVNAATDMIFSLWNGSAFGEKMRITSTGDINILNATATDSKSIGITNAAGSTGWTFGNGITASAHQFIIYDNTAGAERMHIDSEGQVGINTAPLQTALHIKQIDAAEATLKVEARSDTSVNNILSFTTKTGSTSWYHFVGQAGSGLNNKIIIYGNGNVENTNNSYGQVSDENLKENIVDATPKLEDIKKLKVKNFNFKGDDYKQIGMIAQDVEKIFPSLVEEVTDPETKEKRKSLKYSVFVPMLIKSIQELEKRVQELENK